MEVMDVLSSSVYDRCELKVVTRSDRGWGGLEGGRELKLFSVKIGFAYAITCRLLYACFIVDFGFLFVILI